MEMFVLAVVLGFVIAHPTSVHGSGVTIDCPPAFFSFGTSLSDTGNVPLAFPFTVDSERTPYGETFFQRNAFRYSDGRLVLDFMAQAFRFPLLSPYFQSVAPNFYRGVNFAAGGATAINDTSIVPFFLDYQVDQYLRFKQSVTVANSLPSLLLYDSTLLPQNSSFDNGLHILFFGRNDFSSAYIFRGLTPAQAIQTLVPQVVQSTVGAIQTLYRNGARNFLVFNVNPQGCSPQYLTIFGPSANATDFDEFGCLIPYNRVDQAFNAQLFTAIQSLRTSLANSTILHFDFYASSIDVLQNASQFGFSPEKTLVACCGAGGKYNYNPSVSCSNHLPDSTTIVGSCTNPEQYISWDGIHLTDAFNRVLAEHLLTGKFLDPPVNLKEQCHLDFSKFTGVDFEQAYPGGVLIIP